MKVIALMSQQGGAGTTTLALHLAVAAHERRATGDEGLVGPASWRDCSPITVLMLKEAPQGHIQHVPGLGVPFGSTVQPCQIVPDTAIGRLNQMGLRFAHPMRLRHALLGKRHRVTPVRIRTDTGNGRDECFDLAVERDGGRDPFADDIYTNTTRSSTIRSPYAGPLPFLCTTVAIASTAITSGTVSSTDCAACCNWRDNCAPKSLIQRTIRAGDAPIQRATLRMPTWFSYLSRARCVSA